MGRIVGANNSGRLGRKEELEEKTLTTEEFEQTDLEDYLSEWSKN